MAIQQPFLSLVPVASKTLQIQIARSGKARHLKPHFDAIFGFMRLGILFVDQAKYGSGYLSEQASGWCSRCFFAD